MDKQGLPSPTPQPEAPTEASGLGPCGCPSVGSSAISRSGLPYNVKPLERMGEGKGRRTSWVHLNQKSKHSLWLHPRC
ncbi:hypothetical protein Y1Q_0024585 [Alligator mississippiensis]|uniref:Uncharacterized protein n=1 Tax=Alligator mississippiensis TaxID=8496 RepID=A0A151NB33_ALLMI|nr:hypothetical protein Y1Q_0024585 [Alligator mississippiensis]